MSDFMDPKVIDTVEDLARTMCNAERPRRIADREGAPLYDESEVEVQEYWRAVARVAVRFWEGV